ncbi:hypothetical protein GCM10020367_59930 [Streptomyces sannanensis]|uniref:Uncharacterized protein n=1 Tax=Streptomyces sannanensis TaxID=285536 RepID=A0ABP6SKP8_9ACTN
MRWFPAYFGLVPLAPLHRDVHCRRNLWRATDRIGGSVLVAAGDDGRAVGRGPLQDPLAHGRTDRPPLPAPLLGHCDYWADPAFDEEHTGLLDRLPPALPRPRQSQGSSGRSSG